MPSCAKFVWHALQMPVVICSMSTCRKSSAVHYNNYLDEILHVSEQLVLIDKFEIKRLMGRCYTVLVVFAKAFN
jgi:hypothetical protein